MESLGEFGFWLAVGIVLAAMFVSGAIKERVKEREKQETLRRLAELEGAGKLTPETLAYMREKDAAELKFQRQALGLDWGGQPAGWVAATIGALAIFAGLISLTLTSPRLEIVPDTGRLTRVAPPGLDFPLAPVAVMIAIWATGFVIAALVWIIFRKKKNDAQPGA